MDKNTRKPSWWVVVGGIILLIIIFKIFIFSEWRAFSCKSKYGWSDGQGRYSREGEYSAFFRKTMRDGEYIIFKYPGNSKEYTFETSNCKER